MKMEELQDEVERIIRRSALDNLRQIATILKVAEDKLDGSKRELMREIQSVFDDVEAADQKVAMYTSLIPHLTEKDANDLRFLLQPLEKISSEEKADVLEEAMRVVAEAEMKRKLEARDTVELLKCLGETSVFRREFKLSGTVGGDEKHRLTYISLCTQIHEATSKGYKDMEIVGGLRRAVSVGTPLRTYLDSLPADLVTLKEFMIIIRSAYQEKSASELLREMDKMCQKDSEDAQAFLFRALGLRQRIIIAAEAEREVKYEKSQVQSLFLHSLRTGITQDSVRAHILPFLDLSKGTPDNILISEINKAVSDENERLAKRRDGKRSDSKASASGVSTGSTGSTDFEQFMKPMQSLQEQLSKMTTEMNTMREEMGKLRQNKQERRVNWKTGRQDESRTAWKKRACKKCTTDGVAADCKHCWKCGEDGHFSRTCQKTAGN